MAKTGRNGRQVNRLHKMHTGIIKSTTNDVQVITKMVKGLVSLYDLYIKTLTKGIEAYPDDETIKLFIAEANIIPKIIKDNQAIISQVIDQLAKYPTFRNDAGLKPVRKWEESISALIINLDGNVIGEMTVIINEHMQYVNNLLEEKADV